MINNQGNARMTLLVAVVVIAIIAVAYVGLNSTV